MALVEQRPKRLRLDFSRKETITFNSPADGCEMKADVYSPSQLSDDPLPLVFGPHPISWTASEDYHGGLKGLMRGYHPGYYGLAEKYRLILVMPYGHHHQDPQSSLAGPEQIIDMLYLVDTLGEFGYIVDHKRVYACGNSMGGQEALVLAGNYPDRITAVCVFNPIVDLAAWQEDLVKMDMPEVLEYDTANRIAKEVGGLPSEVPAAYAQRSATHYVEALSQVPILLFWSEQDLIVPRQLTHHAYLLYTMIKRIHPTCPIAEYNHTRIHGPLVFDKRTRWQLHEWCDYELALRWLLCHEK